MPAISVIVVNWNGERILEGCLRSLQAQTWSDFEVLLVDNGSTDDSIKVVRSRFPTVKVLALDANYGFCKGSNVGITESTGRYVVLLNNDAEAHPNFLYALYSAAEAHPEVGLCASRMLLYQDRYRVDNCGIGLLVCGVGYPIGAGKPSTNYERPRFVFGACAGAALYRRSMLREIGLFDEDFFSHIEDTDLSWRAQLSGYRCLYVPDAIVYHRGGTTSQRHPEATLFRIQRNKLWTYLKNMPTALLIATLPLHAAYTLYWFFRAASMGTMGTVWRSKCEALAAWRELCSKRNKIQKARRISLTEHLRLMDWSKS